MKFLGFDAMPEAGYARGGNRRVRSAIFEARSALPISAACVVANGVREILSSHLGAPIGMRIFEPSIPPPHAWQTLLRDARLYRVRGTIADAGVILRAADAAALAAMLFGEAAIAQPPERRLSPIECEVLDRLMSAFAANLGTVCGARESHSIERVTGIAGFVTYFELIVTEPVAARIGIALSRDPSPERGAALTADALADVAISAQALLDLGQTDVAAVVRLAAGDVIGLSRSRLQRCALRVGGRAIARGLCGVQNSRYAVAVDARA